VGSGQHIGLKDKAGRGVNERANEDVRMQTEKWLGFYNRQRPHDSLGNLSPIEYLQKFNLETVI
jgi:transposase InsO family protein